jgi:hypothetical protein
MTKKKEGAVPVRTTREEKDKRELHELCRRETKKNSKPQSGHIKLKISFT